MGAWVVLKAALKQGTPILIVFLRFSSQLECVPECVSNWVHIFSHVYRPPPSVSVFSSRQQFIGGESSKNRHTFGHFWVAVDALHWLFHTGKWAIKAAQERHQEIVDLFFISLFFVFFRHTHYWRYFHFSVCLLVWARHLGYIYADGPFSWLQFQQCTTSIASLPLEPIELCHLASSVFEAATRHSGGSLTWVQLKR